MSLAATLHPVFAAASTSQSSSSVVISNLAYLIGAVVLAALIVTVVVIRHHRPRSTQEDMDSFHRGLAALAPDRSVSRHRSGRGRVAQDDLYPDPRPRPRGIPVGADGSAPRRPNSRYRSG